jgi:hypothetical protein
MFLEQLGNLHDSPSELGPSCQQISTMSAPQPETKQIAGNGPQVACNDYSLKGENLLLHKQYSNEKNRFAFQNGA